MTKLINRLIELHQTKNEIVQALLGEYREQMLGDLEIIRDGEMKFPVATEVVVRQLRRDLENLKSRFEGAETLDNAGLTNVRRADAQAIYDAACLLRRAVMRIWLVEDGTTTLERWAQS